MNICIFGASSSLTKDKYIKAVEELGRVLAKRGHRLVFGAGGAGLMGAAARGFKEGGGAVTGIVPEFFVDEVQAVFFDDCDELIYTETMAQRKTMMEEMADVFIAAPGGIGTMEEFFEVLTLKQLGRHRKAIVIFNVDNYYHSLVELLKTAIDEDFLNEHCMEFLEITDDAVEAADYLENYDPTAFDPNVSGYRY